MLSEMLSRSSAASYRATRGDGCRFPPSCHGSLPVRFELRMPDWCCPLTKGGGNRRRFPSSPASRLCPVLDPSVRSAPICPSRRNRAQQYYANSNSVVPKFSSTPRFRRENDKHEKNVTVCVFCPCGFRRPTVNTPSPKRNSNGDGLKRRRKP